MKHVTIVEAPSAARSTRIREPGESPASPVTARTESHAEAGTARRQLSGALILSVTMLGVSAANYLLNLLLARFLTPAEFGDANLAVNLVLAAAAAAAMLQLLSARSGAIDDPEGIDARRTLLRWAWGIGVALGIGLAAGSSALAHALQYLDTTAFRRDRDRPSRLLRTGRHARGTAGRPTAGAAGRQLRRRGRDEGGHRPGDARARLRCDRGCGRHLAVVRGIGDRCPPPSRGGVVVRVRRRGHDHDPAGRIGRRVGRRDRPARGTGRHRERRRRAGQGRDGAGGSRRLCGGRDHRAGAVLPVLGRRAQHVSRGGAGHVGRGAARSIAPGPGHGRVHLCRRRRRARPSRRPTRAATAGRWLSRSRRGARALRRGHRPVRRRQPRRQPRPRHRPLEGTRRPARRGRSADASPDSTRHHPDVHGRCAGRRDGRDRFASLRRPPLRQSIRPAGFQPAATTDQHGDR